MTDEKSKQAAVAVARLIVQALDLAGGFPSELRESVELLEQSAEKMIEYLEPGSTEQIALTLRAAIAAVEGNSATRAVESKAPGGRLGAKNRAAEQ